MLIVICLFTGLSSGAELVSVLCHFLADEKKKEFAICTRHLILFHSWHKLTQRTTAQSLKDYWIYPSKHMLPLNVHYVTTHSAVH